MPGFRCTKRILDVSSVIWFVSKHFSSLPVSSSYLLFHVQHFRECLHHSISLRVWIESFGHITILTAAIFHWCDYLPLAGQGSIAYPVGRTQVLGALPYIYTNLGSYSRMGNKLTIAYVITWVLV